MSPRYLLVVLADVSGQVPPSDFVRRRTGLELAYSNRQMAVFVNPSCACIPLAEEGCILGYLFPRHGPARQLGELTPSEERSIAKCSGDLLLRRFWGGYVAAISASDPVRILRDPSGNFPCYFSEQDGLVLLASDAETIAAMSRSPIVDAEEIGRQLYRAFVPSPQTALRGIRELLAGFELRLPGNLETQELAWSPWDHVAPLEPAEIADRFARTVRHCVTAWGTTSARVLISVSGGLDSSILAAGLASAGADAACLTMFTTDPGGDERPYARALCTHLGLPLIERAYDIGDIDLEEPLGPNLPRPKDRTQANAYERVHERVALELGASAFMTGNGGDHVFGYSQSAAPVADRFLSEGLGQGVILSLLDVCRQTGCSIFDACRQAWRLARGPANYRVRPNPLFLDMGFVASIDPLVLHHPWLDAPPGALPGKAAHIANILRVQPNLEPSWGTRFPVLNPLVSQPIVEMCLAVPTWEMRAGGRDRSLARRAFERELPPLILNRRVKGTPGRFAAQLLDHFRKDIRERLLGGRLAADGITDASAVERVLAGERPVGDLERVRLLELVSAEAWIDHWTAQRQSLSVGPIP